MEDHDPFVDRLLDASLERLGNEEPRAGLENRILARLRSEQKRAIWFGLGWKFATALAVVTIAAGALYVYRWIWQVPALAPSKSVVIMTSRAVAPAAAAGSNEIAEPETAAHKNHRHVHKSIRPHQLQLAAAPRQPVFPSPAPLSEEEKLLLIYARNAPPSNTQPFDQQIEPLAKLKPLEITSLDLPQLRQEIKEPTTRRN